MAVVAAAVAGVLAVGLASVALIQDQPRVGTFQINVSRRPAAIDIPAVIIGTADESPSTTLLAPVELPVAVPTSPQSSSTTVASRSTATTAAPKRVTVTIAPSPTTTTTARAASHGPGRDPGKGTGKPADD